MHTEAFALWRRQKYHHRGYLIHSPFFVWHNSDSDVLRRNILHRCHKPTYCISTTINTTFVTICCVQCVSELIVQQLFLHEVSRVHLNKLSCPFNSAPHFYQLLPWLDSNDTGHLFVRNTYFTINSQMQWDDNFSSWFCWSLWKVFLIPHSRCTYDKNKYW